MTSPHAAASDPAAPDAAAVATIVLGFDYGARRIGIAVGNRISHSARALEVLANSAQGPDWPRLDRVVREWGPQALLVGLPLTLDDAEQANSHAARDFCAALESRYRLPSILVDERRTSREAATRFAQRRANGAARRKDSENLDAVAAEIIVERWLDGR